LRRSLMEYQEELDERATPVLGLAPEPMSDEEEALLRAYNVLLLAGLTTRELLELDEVARDRAEDHEGGRRELVDMFMEGFFLAKYVYFHEGLATACAD
jgi:hypothetical protein